MNGDHRDRFYTPSGQKVTELEKLLFVVAGRSGKRSHGIDLIEEQLLLRGFLFGFKTEMVKPAGQYTCMPTARKFNFFISIRWESSQYEKVETKY